MLNTSEERQQLTSSGDSIMVVVVVISLLGGAGSGSKLMFLPEFPVDYECHCFYGFSKILHFLRLKEQGVLFSVGW